MKNISLLKRFSILMGALSLIIFFDLALVVVGSNKLENLLYEMNRREMPVLDKSHQLKLAVVEVQQWLSDISATRARDGLNDGFDMARENADKFHELIRQLVQLDPDSKAQYLAMVPFFEAYYESGVQMAQAYIDQGPAGGNKMMGQFDESAGKITAMVDEFVADSQAQARSLGETQNIYMDDGKVALIVGIAFIQLVLGVIFWMMAKALRLMPEVVREFDIIADGDLTSTRQISTANDEVGHLSRGFDNMRMRLREVLASVNSSSDQVKQSAQVMTEHTEQTLSAIDEQRRDIETVASSMTQMSTTARDIASSAEQAAASARKVDSEARTGSEVVSSAVSTIQSLVTRVVEAADVIKKLEQDSENIGGILEVIGGIAEQTNLLALNAAIEAARAGDQGRGFAVVADEVRSLASRTQDSTTEIHAMIARLQSGARAAATAMEKGRAMTEESINQANRASESLETISLAIEQINEMNAQIAAASEEQSVVADEMAASVHQVSAVSERTAAGARDTADAGRQMASLSKDLHKIVEQFRL